MGGDVSVSGISFFYLFIEISLTVPWLALFFLLERKSSRKTADEQTGYRHFFNAIFLGVMIAVTYGIVLAAMAYAKNVSYIVAFRQLSLPIGVFLGLVILKEQGSLLRYAAVLLMAGGLVLVGTG
jgi:drug/metabolite transporter (DMT)-like permease